MDLPKTQPEIPMCVAMHGAIVADVFRVPWVPVTAYPDISRFKWIDWTSSMKLDYQPVRVPSVYHDIVVEHKVQRRLSRSVRTARLASQVYRLYQNHWVRGRFEKSLLSLRAHSGSLSDDNILRGKFEQLIASLETFASGLGKTLRLPNDSEGAIDFGRDVTPEGMTKPRK